MCAFICVCIYIHVLYIYMYVYIHKYLDLMDILLNLFFLNRHIMVLPFLLLQLGRWKKFKGRWKVGNPNRWIYITSQMNRPWSPTYSFIWNVRVKLVQEFLILNTDSGSCMVEFVGPLYLSHRSGGYLDEGFPSLKIARRDIKIR